MSDPNPYGHLGEEAFNRLPESVKEEMRQKMARDQTNAVAYQAKLKERAWQGAVVGGISSMVLAYFLGHWPFILAMGAAGGACGLLIARAKLGHLTGMLLMGGMGIAGTIIGYSAGAIGAIATSAFFCWLMWCAVGVVISKSMESDRMARDTF